MAGHTEGASKDLFCSIRAETCECGNKYRQPCDAVAATWDADPRAVARNLKHKVSQYAQKYKDDAQLRGHEAHHIACVAAVSSIITTNMDIDLIVRKTDWCVNEASNMIALPMWSHTISWYIDLASDKEMDLLSSVDAPPFAGLAQHDYDHGKYIQSVNKDLEQLVDAVRGEAEDHEEASSTLAGGLARVITKYQAKLKGRATHASWQDGEKNPNGDWYKAFSMADDPSARAFPASGNRMARKIKEVRDAFLKLFGNT